MQYLIKTIAKVFCVVCESVKSRKIKGLSDVAIIKYSRYFDWKWYVKRYGLNGLSASEAAEHYLEQGWKQYYNPSPSFVTIAYFVANWDVKEADKNPLWHYEKYGKKEHRDLGGVKWIQKEYELVKKSEYFDEKWYRDFYKIDSKVDAVYHFLFEGVQEYYNPSLEFSSLDYMMDNIYQIGDTLNPLVHYEKNKDCSDKRLIVKPVKDKIVGQKFEKCEYVDLEKKKQLVKKREQAEVHSQSVDIVICVYNAYEDVKKCIESVLDYTSAPYRIIIVDDNSAELTATYLKEMSEKHDCIELIRNESDLHGYTYAANIGLRNATADYCIMLNSDTIVSEHWLDNMIACAESDEGIGVVGPLSNTASWQSIPKLTDKDGDWCHNVIPDGYSVHDVATLIEKNSAKIYPQVPLLNGFCLMISRKVIDTIGYFDEENFGRGFAEEDDYNTRAVKAGFKLAIADDTYIFHAQSKSYSDEKRLMLCKLSGESLREKHGREYIDNCSTFMATNKVLESIRKRTEVLFDKEQIYQKCRKLYQGKKILFLLPASNASGGANVIFQESMALRKMGLNITIMNLENNRKEYEQAYGSVDIPVIWVSDYSKLNSKIASQFDVVVCTLYKTVEYCKFLGKLDKPKLVYYIQDYEPYFIQEEIKNGDYDHEEYEVAVKSYSLIPNCINVTKTQWNCDEVKKNANADCIVLGPSMNTELFMPKKAYSNGKLVVTAMIRPSTKRRAPQMTMDVLRKLSLEFGEGLDIRIFGSDPEHDLYSKLFFAKQQKDFKYTNYGLTSPEETAELLAQSDIFLDLSQFQAMGLTAMEAMACGCATVVPVNGGTGCFARNEENCLVVDTSEFINCYRAARTLVVNKQLRDKLGHVALCDMAECYPEKVAEKLLGVVFDKRGYL